VIQRARSAFGPVDWDEAWHAGTKRRIDDVVEDELPSRQSDTPRFSDAPLFLSDRSLKDTPSQL